MSDRPRPKRHRWVKLRLHVYMCRDCGTGYENVEIAPVQWRRLYYLSNGDNTVDDHVPPCELGPRGARALRKYADAL